MTGSTSKTGIRPGEGYKGLIIWKNAAVLRQKVYAVTRKFPRSEYRRVSQMTDAARSIKQNIQEGYKSGSALKFLNFLSISKGSLGEVAGDISDCLEDDLITPEEFAVLDKLCGTTDYLLGKFMDSLRKMHERGQWHNHN